MVKAPARPQPQARARKGLPVARQKGYDANTRIAPKIGTRLMLSGLFALIFASAFAGAALYLVLVEQPARLALDDASMIANGRPATGAASPSGRPRGAGGFGGPRRLQPRLGYPLPDGALLVLASWPYTYFVIVPLNNRLLAAGGAAGRRRARDRDLLGPARMGPVCAGAASVAVFAWTLASNGA